VGRFSAVSSSGTVDIRGQTIAVTHGKSCVMSMVVVDVDVAVVAVRWTPMLIISWSLFPLPLFDGDKGLDSIAEASR